ncbi:hypothetical protein B0H13DRAFT_1589672, partial [Mycena leptocephala]
IHPATCDLCGSGICGVHYKCTDCPNFDSCSGCFGVTPAQHPHHSFVRLAKASDYIRREVPEAQVHHAICTVCSISISGVRYKCMQCPDFDLCEDCEALSIPVHPDTHPMLKMRSASTVVPAVYRSPSPTFSALKVGAPNQLCNAGPPASNRACLVTLGKYDGGRGF